MIRYAEKSDAEAVYSLMAELEGREPDRELFARTYLENLRTRCYLVYQKSDRVIAFCGLNTSSPLHHERKIAEIEELVVAACARGEGVGKELLQRAISVARAGGCEIIELSSNLARTDAHKFYEREGFKRTHVKLTMALI